MESSKTDSSACESSLGLPEQPVSTSCIATTSTELVENTRAREGTQSVAQFPETSESNNEPLLHQKLDIISEAAATDPVLGGSTIEDMDAYPVLK